MACPICGNTFDSGRCHHSLDERVSSGNRIGRILDKKDRGEITFGQAFDTITYLKHGNGYLNKK